MSFQCLCCWCGATLISFSGRVGTKTNSKKITSTEDGPPPFSLSLSLPAVECLTAKILGSRAVLWIRIRVASVFRSFAHPLMKI